MRKNTTQPCPLQGAKHPPPDQASKRRPMTRGDAIATVRTNWLRATTATAAAVARSLRPASRREHPAPRSRADRPHDRRRRHPGRHCPQAAARQAPPHRHGYRRARHLGPYRLRDSAAPHRRGGLRGRGARLLWRRLPGRLPQPPRGALPARHRLWRRPRRRHCDRLPSRGPTPMALAGCRSSRSSARWSPSPSPTSSPAPAPAAVSPPLR